MVYPSKLWDIRFVFTPGLCDEMLVGKKRDEEA
jgi:hypothetical protein